MRKNFIFETWNIFCSWGGEIKFLNFIDQEHQSKHIPGNYPPLPPPKNGHISISEKFEFKAKSCKDDEEGNFIMIKVWSTMEIKS